MTAAHFIALQSEVTTARAWLKGRTPDGDAASPCSGHEGHSLVAASTNVELVRSRAGEVIGMRCLRCGASVSRIGLQAAHEIAVLRREKERDANDKKWRALAEYTVPETCIREGCDEPLRAVLLKAKDRRGRKRRYCSARCRNKVKQQKRTAQLKARKLSQGGET